MLSQSEIFLKIQRGQLSTEKVENVDIGNISIAKIRNFLSENLGEDIFNKCRIEELVFKRKIAINTLYNLGFRKSHIARIIKRNHSTIIFNLKEIIHPSYKKIKDKYKDLEYQLILFLLENNIPFKQPKAKI